MPNLNFAEAFQQGLKEAEDETRRFRGQANREEL
jgi:hypothetical protein